MSRGTPERFMERFQPEPNSGCWIWTGTLHDCGYGLLSVDGRRQYAHRYSYVLHVGPISFGQHICHRCDNTFCVNPDHLFAGSAGDNIRDAKRKGRLAAQRNPALWSAVHGPRIAAVSADPVRRAKRQQLREAAGYANACKGEANRCAKLDRDKVLAIRCDRRTQVAIAAEYGISPSLVEAVRNKKVWKHV